MTSVETLKENWAGRSQSEKQIIILLGALVVCTCFYLLVVDPLQQWQEVQKRQLAAKQKELPQVERLVKAYQKQGKSTQVENKDLIGVIHQSLSRHGLSMQGFQPGKNNSARLSLTDVQYKPLVSWLYDIEYKYQFTVEEFSLAKTKKAGLLNVTVYLSN